MANQRPKTIVLSLNCRRNVGKVSFIVQYITD